MTSSEFLSLPQLVRQAVEGGLDVSERTVRFYTARGLLPKPQKAPFKGADGRVAYYPAHALRRLRRIQQLKNQGFTLEQIARVLEQRTGESLRQLAVAPAGDWRREVVFRFLQHLNSEESRRARVEFAARVAPSGPAVSGEAAEEPPEDEEAALHRATRTYLARLAAQMVGDAAAERYVEEFFLELPPDDLEKRLTPFRDWRARLAREEQERRGDAYFHLRRLTSDRLLGLVPAEDFRIQLQILRERFRRTVVDCSAFDPNLVARLVRGREMIEAGMEAMMAAADAGPQALSAALETFGRGFQLLRLVERIGASYLEALGLE